MTTYLRSLRYPRLRQIALALVLLFAPLLNLAQPTPALAATPGTVVAWGYNDFGQTDIPAGLSGVTAIAEGGFHSLALKSDGTVVAWGNNDFGQLNIPAGLSGVMAIAGGYAHSLALKSDGTVVAWGLNCCGQLSIPAGLSGVTAIAGGDVHSLALKSDGTVVAWGDNGAGQTDIPAGLSGVTAIAGGGAHSLALVADTTAPTIIPQVSGTAGANGWYVSDVTVSWSVTDGESAVTAQSGCDPVTVSADTASVTFTCSASSAGGSSSQSVTIQRDATAPVVSVTGVSDGASYTLGSVPTAGCDTTDGLSGVATQATVNVTGGGGPLGADGTGTFTATCSGATDNAGNAANPNSVSYTVNAPPLRQQVESVRSNLAALLPSGNSNTDKALQKAQSKLDQALAANLWEVDGNHLTLIGDDVFNRLYDAVQALSKLKHPAQAIRNASSTLATISRALAQLALDEAIAGQGDAKKIAKAQSKLSKGDSEVAKGKLDKAIAQYEDAWEYAQQALGIPVAAGLDPAADEPTLEDESDTDAASDPTSATESLADDTAGTTTLRNVIFLPLVSR